MCICLCVSLCDFKIVFVSGRAPVFCACMFFCFVCVCVWLFMSLHELGHSGTSKTCLCNLNPLKSECRQSVYYDFRLPLLCTVCLYQGRFVPLENLEHPLQLSASQNRLSTLSIPRHSPVLGCDLGWKRLKITGKALKPTRKQFIKQKAHGIEGISHPSVSY